MRITIRNMMTGNNEMIHAEARPSAESALTFNFNLCLSRSTNETVAEGGRRHPLALAAHEQLAAVMHLDLGDGDRDRRLRHVEDLRCPGDVARVGGGHGVAQLLERKI